MRRGVTMSLLATGVTTVLAGAAAALVPRRALGVDTVFVVEPTRQTVDVGERFDVQVTVRGATRVAGFEFTLDFDPRILNVESVNEGPFLSSTGRQVKCFSKVSDEGDAVRFGCASLGMSPRPPSGDGVVARIALEARAAGESWLRLSFAQITDEFAESGCSGDGGYCSTIGSTVTVRGAEPLPTVAPGEAEQPGRRAVAPVPTGAAAAATVAPGAQATPLPDQQPIPVGQALPADRQAGGGALVGAASGDNEFPVSGAGWAHVGPNKASRRAILAILVTGVLTACASMALQHRHTFRPRTRSFNRGTDAWDGSLLEGGGFDERLGT